MLISTALFVGDDVDADEQYREFRDLTTQAGDMTSLAIATAGRILSFIVNDNRVPEAAALAAELDEMVASVDCDAATKGIILFAIAYARFANCEFDAALQVIDALLALPQDVPTMELALASAIGAPSRSASGDHEHGRRLLRESFQRARALPPACQAVAWAYHGLMAAWGYVKPRIWSARCATLCGAPNHSATCSASSPRSGRTALCCCGGHTSHDEAIELLERARAQILQARIVQRSRRRCVGGSGDRRRP